MRRTARKQQDKKGESTRTDVKLKQMSGGVCSDNWTANTQEENMCSCFLICIQINFILVFLLRWYLQWKVKPLKVFTVTMLYVCKILEKMTNCYCAGCGLWELAHGMNTRQLPGNLILPMPLSNNLQMGHETLASNQTIVLEGDTEE